ncbi:hypothetical protein THASP1DRAFT_23322 [Thamnocephalis sphaerospora]|uniref:Protein kinase domain-containing protein n=1 Tax=Thamnocephalis sphaerospora TaxID=78915 RepID=A0A4V1IWU2_9FUNG|nr:hypothetical protein THASP1DRAFT_23322 [Thamnocephalis sphaerospora]|eukprot:RKP08749.1 hypothetical protein THASP1DRAFT_23322 [Thamnocephalis sphaerospora]
MHAFSIRTLLVIAAAALLSSDLSYADLTQPDMSPSGSASHQIPAQPGMLPSYDTLFANPAQSVSDTEWPSRPGLYVVKWHPEQSNGMRTAVVDYSSTNGLLKCTPHVNQHNNEVTALSTSNGYRCLILEMIDGSFFTMYANGFVHGNITPDTVYLQLNSKGAFKLILTGFEGSHPFSEFPQASIIKPEGYSPPEDFVESDAFQYARDAWMFGATLYFMTNGHPPYGFAYSKRHKAMLPVPAEELQQTMEQVAETGKNSYLPVKTRSKALLYAIKSLLVSIPNGRAGADDIAFSEHFKTFASMPKNNNLWQRWGLLKSRLPIVGTPSWLVEPPPREHVEDTSTRYKPL